MPRPRVTFNMNGTTSSGASGPPNDTRSTASTGGACTGASSMPGPDGGQGVLTGRSSRDVGRPARGGRSAAPEGVGRRRGGERRPRAGRQGQPGVLQGVVAQLLDRPAGGPALLGR